MAAPSTEVLATGTVDAVSAAACSDDFFAVAFLGATLLVLVVLPAACLPGSDPDFPPADRPTPDAFAGFSFNCTALTFVVVVFTDLFLSAMTSAAPFPDAAVLLATAFNALPVFLTGAAFVMLDGFLASSVFFVAAGFLGATGFFAEATGPAAFGVDFWVTALVAALASATGAFFTPGFLATGETSADLAALAVFAEAGLEAACAVVAAFFAGAAVAEDPAFEPVFAEAAVFATVFAAVFATAAGFADAVFAEGVFVTADAFTADAVFGVPVFAAADLAEVAFAVAALPAGFFAGATLVLVLDSVMANSLGQEHRF